MFLSSVPPPSVENVPAMANAIPGLREKCSASRRNRRSPSARKIVRIQPGIVFGFIPEWRSACPGFPTTRHRVQRRRVRFVFSWRSPSRIVRCNSNAIPDKARVEPGIAGKVRLLWSRALPKNAYVHVNTNRLIFREPTFFLRVFLWNLAS